MVKYFFPIIFIVNNGIALAQEFQGRAIYQSKTAIDFERMGGNGPNSRNLSEEQRQMIMSRMKQAFEKTFSLTFNETTSIFKEVEGLEEPGSDSSSIFAMIGSFASGTLHKDIVTKTYKDQRELYGKLFLITDSLPNFDWKTTGKTKNIGKYLCYEAKAMKIAKTHEVAPFERKDSMGGIQKDKDSTDTRLSPANIPKEVEVTAWYTMDIPINQGPAEYWGLPGLILEVNTGKTAILCSKITLNPKEKIKIKSPKRGKKVTQQEYNLIFKAKMLEIRENFRSRGGRRPDFIPIKD